ncbi:hypothetical protein BSLG_009051 [Batrachochytrium salamandrivorans]|nr:hypothetical protein BASA60_006386 [Batrachochytrium salamandrivorans]KAJ1330599.1 hypothetical protein BSLG_009051 [Batrachochytrium salamandrivorans]
MAQRGTPPKTHADCIPIATSNACNAWIGQGSSSSNEAFKVLASTAIDNSASGFDSAMNGLSPLVEAFAPLDCPGLIQLLHSRGDAAATTATTQASPQLSLRYPASFVCYSTLVNSAAVCGSNQATSTAPDTTAITTTITSSGGTSGSAGPAVPPLCIASCSYFVQTLQTLISTAATCNTAAPLATLQARALIVQGFHATCLRAADLSLSSGNNSGSSSSGGGGKDSSRASGTPACISAVAQESQNCGFGNSDSGVQSALSWCKITKPDDPCCAATLAVLPTSTVLSNTTVLRNTTILSNTTVISPLPMANQSPSQSSLYIAVGCSIAGIALAALVFFCCALPFWKRRRSIKHIDNSQQPPSPIYPSLSDVKDLELIKSSMPQLDREKTVTSISIPVLSDFQLPDSSLPMASDLSPTLPLPKRSSGFDLFTAWSGTSSAETALAENRKRESTLTTSSLRTDSRLATQVPVPIQLERTTSHLPDLLAPKREGTFYATHVLQSYQSEQPDELNIQVGDLVHVVRVFEDGWGKGRNATTGETGIFPVVCLAVL